MGIKSNAILESIHGTIQTEDLSSLIKKLNKKRNSLSLNFNLLA